jgi:hypothetical protein
MKAFLEGTHTYIPETEIEYQQLTHNWLTNGQQWRQLSAKWGTRSAPQ